MRDAINYLKLDLRVSRRTLLFTIVPIIFMAYMFWGQEAYILGITYLFLIQNIFINTPFITQGSENIQQLYNIFPTKISKMVLGRYIYLALWYLIIFLVEAVLIMYLDSISKITGREITVMYLSEILIAIIVFIQYPINYKIGFEHTKYILNFICIVPAMGMMVLPELLINGRLFGGRLDNIVDLAINNKTSLVIFCVFILIITGCVSYFLSYRICRNMEV